MNRGQWQLAIDSLGSPEPNGTDRSFFYSATALSRCHLALDANQQALHWAQCALQSQPAHHSLAQWQYAHLLAARAELAQGGLDAAIGWLTAAYKCGQTNPHVNKLLAESLINRYGDWSAASQLFSKPGTSLPLPRDHAWFGIQSQIYNGCAKPETLTRTIVDYRQRYLSPLAIAQPTPRAAPDHPAPHRKRLGLASPMFCASPVYFLCIGALRHLAQDFDLVFFYTGKVQDWATAEFLSLASDWHEARGLSATALTSQMRRSNLDVLIDLGGWLDQTLLQVMAQRPAPKQYKWVGGQSSTTGLRTFNGYITDCHQSPHETAALYSEPLAVMPGGYVTYTPPPYMPAVRAATPDISNTLSAGIVAHPKKLSALFLRYLRGQIQAYAFASSQPVNLCFLGWRYGSDLLQQRINLSLGLDDQARHGPVHIQYRAGTGHAQQLELVAALDWVVDTFPYTSGVTALEALALGVPIRTHAGPHFSQRHGYSHARFAGMQHEDILLSQLGALGSHTHKHRGQTLLPPQCDRLSHVALAQSLSQLFGRHTLPSGAQA